jgi:hypothetical protein
MFYPCDGFFAAHDQILNVHVDIGERGENTSEELEHASLGGRYSRSLFVFDEVLSDQFTEPVEIAGVDALVTIPHRLCDVHALVLSVAARLGRSCTRPSADPPDLPIGAWKRSLSE